MNTSLLGHNPKSDGYTTSLSGYNLKSETDISSASTT